MNIASLAEAFRPAFEAIDAAARALARALREIFPPAPDLPREVEDFVRRSAAATERQAARARATRPRPADYRAPAPPPARPVTSWVASRRAWSGR